jgi:hypothetical protein
MRRQERARKQGVRLSRRGVLLVDAALLGLLVIVPLGTVEVLMVNAATCAPDRSTP